MIIFPWVGGQIVGHLSEASAGESLIVRQLHQLAIAKQIGARISHVSKDQFAAGGIDGCQRRPQSLRVLSPARDSVKSIFR